MPGVNRASVNYFMQSAYVEFNLEAVSLKKIIEAIRSAGYQSGINTLRIRIKGMTCASCVTMIEGALEIEGATYG